MNYVYLFHFAPPLHHAGHYTGCTTNLRMRWLAHAERTAATLTAAVLDAGHAIIVARVWQCRPHVAWKCERWIKDMHGADHFCPVCCAANYPRRPRMLPRGVTLPPSSYQLFIPTEFKHGVTDGTLPIRE